MINLSQNLGTLLSKIRRGNIYLDFVECKGVEDKRPVFVCWICRAEPNTGCLFNRDDSTTVCLAER